MKMELPYLSQAAATLRSSLLALCCAVSVPSMAQTISDVPLAVKNNVPPNLMFMIDNSGSMRNIVPTSPYDEGATYTASCPGSQTVSTGSQVDISIVSGEPRFVAGGVTYNHTSLTSIAGLAQRCFSNTGTYRARLLGDNAGIPSGYLPAEYTGHYLNWYFGNFGGPVTSWTNRKRVSTGSVETRMEIAKTSAKSVVDSLPVSISGTTNPAVRLGLSSYNGDNGGTRNQAMKNLISPDSTNTSTAIGKTTFKDSIDALTPSGSTPLSEALADIGRYFSTGYNGNTLGVGYDSVGIESFLRQNGRNSCLAGATCNVTQDADATTTLARPIQYHCQRSFAFLMTDGRPQSDQAFSNNTYLRDYDRDCAGANASNCVSSGDPTAYDRKTTRTYESAGSDYLDDVAKALFDIDLRPNLVAPAGRTKQRNNLLTYTIGFADLQVQNDPLLINTAQQGGGLFLSAQDGPTLTKAFESALSDAFAKDAASSAVAVANAQITINNIGYASSYNSGTWYGELEAYSLDTSTALPIGPRVWSAQLNLDAMAPSSRKIASFNGASGRPFTATNFAGTPASLTSGVIDWLRGDRSGEGTTYRRRQHVLGDIVNAEPVVVNYSDGTPAIFQAANDGMLHVFDGSISSTTRGQELWAYVPRLLHANLAVLATAPYSHRFYMDATPAAAEVTGLGSMTRLLVGGLGKGGPGYYALDISSYLASTETDVASKVKWEFGPANMGYSFGKPLIVNTAAGWRVIVASGYDNGTALGGDGVGRVWVLNPANGAVIATLTTATGSASNPSGLAHLASLANAAPDAVVRYVFGGDLLGNMWRFDLDTNQVTKIATLADGTGGYQPVTTAPTIGPVAGNSSKFFVYVGTGRYFADEDVPGNAGANTFATQTQTMYGIADDTSLSVSLPNIRGTNGTSCPSDGGSADFVCQAVTTADGRTYAATTNAVDLASRRGWYMDLPIASGRVIGSAALTTTGTLAFTVNVPTNLPCDPGGSSYFFGIDAATGGSVAQVVGGNTYFEAGVFLANALASRPVIVQTAAGKRALIRLSDKTIGNPLVREPSSMTAPWRRIYWRTLN